MDQRSPKSGAVSANDAILQREPLRTRSPKSSNSSSRQTNSSRVAPLAEVRESQQLTQATKDIGSTTITAPRDLALPVRIKVRVAGLIAGKRPRCCRTYDAWGRGFGSGCNGGPQVDRDATYSDVLCVADVSTLMNN